MTGAPDSRSATVRIILFAQRPHGGPIDLDVTLRQGKLDGQILGTDPEIAAAEKAIEEHVRESTMAGPVPTSLELSLDRVMELVRRKRK